jgi:glyoxylase-like metal-dependent hydrolase (beta-lactamase superfamily II)
VWDELADGVFRRRYEYLDLNVGMVTAADGVLLVDTRGSAVEAAELITDLRAITSLPVRWVIDTHWHWDHAFGNSEFPTATIWGHSECRRALAERGEEAKVRLAATIDPGKRPEMLAVVIRLPDRVLTSDDTIDLGDRTVTVRHHGRGHTEGDVVVEVDGTGVCFGGDLIEESGPPWFGDGFPVAWPDTVARMAGATADVFVPGHGDVMSPACVAGQLDELRAVAGLAAESHAAGLPLGAIDLTRSPYPADVTAEAMGRAYLELGDG